MPLEHSLLKTLPAPDYSEEERRRIVDYLMQLKGDQIRSFLATKDLVRSGPKQELRERIAGYLDEGNLRYEDIVDYIDSVVPWGKQHVFLYAGPDRDVGRWRQEAEAEKLLKQGRVYRLRNAKVPLGLPERLQVSSIEYEPGRLLGILAVERRDHWERREDKDRTEDIDGLRYEFRAYAGKVARGLVILRWNLVANAAELRITQLPSGNRYEEVEERFAELVSPWLNIQAFTKVDLRPAIAELHSAEEKGAPETRQRDISYRTTGGRDVSASSPTRRDSVLGERGVDGALKEIRVRSVGRLGNVYWLPAAEAPGHHNPLQHEVHTIIVAYRNRINFTTPNAREEVEYVLSRVRALSS